MSLLRTIAHGLRTLLRRDAAESELDDEVRHYLELLAREKVRGGLSPEAAMRAARLELGGVEQVKERVRAGGWEAAADAVGRDVGYAARTQRRNPAFTAVAVLTLALGI